MFARKINTPPPCVLEYTTALSLCWRLSPTFCVFFDYKCQFICTDPAAAAIVKSQKPNACDFFNYGWWSVYVIVAVLSVIGV